MTTAIADALRGLTAAAVMLIGTIHLVLWAQGFRELPTVGVLFLLDAAAAFAIAIAVLLWRHWLPLLGAAGLGAMTAGAFWISVLRGLAGVHESAGGTLQVMAQVADYAAVVVGLSAGILLVQHGARARRPRPAVGRTAAASHSIDGDHHG
jgi:hypothetical protein